MSSRVISLLVKSLIFFAVSGPGSYFPDKYPYTALLCTPNESANTWTGIFLLLKYSANFCVNFIFYDVRVMLKVCQRLF